MRKEEGCGHAGVEAELGEGDAQLGPGARHPQVRPAHRQAQPRPDGGPVDGGDDGDGEAAQHEEPLVELRHHGHVVLGRVAVPRHQPVQVPARAEGPPRPREDGGPHLDIEKTEIIYPSSICEDPIKPSVTKRQTSIVIE